MSKKNVLIGIVFFILVSATVFLIFAFGAWKINPATWDSGARFFYALCTSVILVIAIKMANID